MIIIDDDGVMHKVLPMDTLDNLRVEIADYITHSPSVNPQERVGYWIDADGDNAICSCCNRLNHLYGAYCKHCGAKMVEPQERSNKE